MNKTIAIISDFIGISEDNIYGGSETWILEISKQFRKNGYYVFIFSPNTRWTLSNNIEYIPINYLEYFISHVKIDYTLIFRYILSNNLNILSKYINNHNVYWICHDVVGMIDNKNLTLEMIQSNQWLSENLNKFICMSDFGKQCIQVNIPLPDDKFCIIGNGINFDYIPPIEDNERDNSFLWSSRYERGLKLFSEQIFPHIKEKYPDSKIYVAQYENYLPEEFLNNPDIVFLGSLNKHDLYKEMQKHKVYFYPNTFPETFCITILEAILNGNDLITAFRHGPTTTLRLFQDSFLPPDYDFNEETNLYVANLIIDKIENYNNKDRVILRKIMINYIRNNYSWENIYNQFKEKVLI